MRRDGSWITPHVRPQAPLRLFCHPCAGGQASEYFRWSEALAEEAELVALQLPGRGALHQEASIRSMAGLTARIVPELLPLLDRPFVFFGHSLGARIAADLCIELRHLGAALPALFIASGSVPPQLSRLEPHVHAATYDDFVAELRLLGGTPEAILGNRGLLELFLPSLRADFELFESYCWRTTQPLPMDLAIWGGLDDPRVGVDVAMQWAPLFSGRVRENFFPGGHMFLSNEQSGADCLGVLKRALRDCAVRHGSARPSVFETQGVAP